MTLSPGSVIISLISLMTMIPLCNTVMFSSYTNDSSELIIIERSAPSESYSDSGKTNDSLSTILMEVMGSLYESLTCKEYPTKISNRTVEANKFLLSGIIGIDEEENSFEIISAYFDAFSEANGEQRRVSNSINNGRDVNPIEGIKPTINPRIEGGTMDKGTISTVSENC